jgi:hypothetical protein
LKRWLNTVVAPRFNLGKRNWRSALVVQFLYRPYKTLKHRDVVPGVCEWTEDLFLTGTVHLSYRARFAPRDILKVFKSCREFNNSHNAGATGLEPYRFSTGLVCCSTGIEQHILDLLT